MLQVLRNSTVFREIEALIPDKPKYKTLLEIDFTVDYIEYNPPVGIRMEITILAFYVVKEFRNSEPFDIVYAASFFDIVAKEGIQVKEIYNLSLQVAKTLREFATAKNIPVKDGEFPREQPKKTKEKIVRMLKEANELALKNQYNQNLN